MSAVQATINSWRLGWNFTAKEAIQSASNVYTPGVQTIALDPPNVQLEGSGVNDTVKPFSWTEIAFLGTKSTITVPDAQYKASPLNPTPKALPYSMPVKGSELAIMNAHQCMLHSCLGPLSSTHWLHAC